MSPVCSGSPSGTVCAEAGAAAASASTDAPSARITDLFMAMFPPRGPLTACSPQVPVAFGNFMLLVAQSPCALLVSSGRIDCQEAGEAMLQSGTTGGRDGPAAGDSSISTSCSSAPACRASAPPITSRRAARASTYVILEGREAIGGTWDLFRYPGIRSDSDMYTLGYSFRPWEEAKAIADGPSILRYVNDTADHYDIRRHIRFRHQVKKRRLVVGRRALDGRGGAHRQRRAGPLQLQLAAHVQRLLQLFRGLRSRTFPARRASAAGSSIRNSGPRISTTRAGRWS